MLSSFKVSYTLFMMTRLTDKTKIQIGLLDLKRQNSKTIYSSGEILLIAQWSATLYKQFWQM